MRLNHFLLSVLVGLCQWTSPQFIYAQSDVESTILYVDLGLPSGTLWATRNFGAHKFTEVGGLYYWGQTNLNDTECLTYNYDFHSSWKEQGGNDLNQGIGRYICYLIKNNKRTDIILFGDIAHIGLGEHWRIPNKWHWEELIHECRWDWMTLDNTPGYFISRHFNLEVELKGKSQEEAEVYLKKLLKSEAIFLPAAGFSPNTLKTFNNNNKRQYKRGQRTNQGIKGFYWSSEDEPTKGVYSSNTKAVNLTFEENNVKWNKNYVKTTLSYRDVAMSVRPVRVKRLIKFQMNYNSNIVMNYGNSIVPPVLNIELEYGNESDPNALEEIRRYISFHSTNPEVATVDTKTGEITSIAGPGQTHIIATYDESLAQGDFRFYKSLVGNETSYSITVNNPTIDMWWDHNEEDVTNATVNYDKSDELPILGIDGDESLYDVVRYVSSNPEVATIDEGGEITALKSGMTTITAIIPADTSKNITQTDCRYNLNVVLPEIDEVKEVEEIKMWWGLNGEDATNTTQVVTLGGSYTLPKVNIDSDKNLFNLVKFTSSNPEVASVGNSTQDRGRISILTAGVTKITAILPANVSNGTPRMECGFVLQVQEPLNMNWVIGNNVVTNKTCVVTYREKHPILPILEISPSEAIKYVEYTSSNPEVVDFHLNKELKLKWYGKATITARVKSNPDNKYPEKSCSVEIDVQKAPVQLTWDAWDNQFIMGGGHFHELKIKIKFDRDRFNIYPQDVMKYIEFISSKNLTRLSLTALKTTKEAHKIKDKTFDFVTVFIPDREDCPYIPCKKNQQIEILPQIPIGTPEKPGIKWDSNVSVRCKWDERDKVELPMLIVNPEKYREQVSYESTNESVATIDSNGKVTIVGIGDAQIVATLNGDTTQYNITVFSEP